MMKTRIYLVNGHGCCRLVRAANRAQALGHVARNTFRVSVASQDDLERLLIGGKVKVEVATAGDAIEEGEGD